MDLRCPGVSCASPHACAAVGFYFNKAEQSEPYSETWDGSRWRLQATPDPATSGDRVVYPLPLASAGAARRLDRYRGTKTACTGSSPPGSRSPAIVASSSSTSPKPASRRGSSAKG
jgi:hypothetical protein